MKISKKEVEITVTELHDLFSLPAPLAGWVMDTMQNITGVKMYWPKKEKEKEKM